MKKLLVIAAVLFLHSNIYAQKKDSTLPCTGNVNQFDPNRDMKNCYTYDSAHPLPTPRSYYAVKKKRRHRDTDQMK